MGFTGRDPSIVLISEQNRFLVDILSAGRVTSPEVRVGWKHLLVPRSSTLNKDETNLSPTDLRLFLGKVQLV